MFSRLVVATGVMLVFGPMFAVVALTLIPGKENWPFSIVETRQPLSTVGATCSKDVSSQSLNLWETIKRSFLCLSLSVEATVSPQANKEEILPSWTSSHMSKLCCTTVTTNSHHLMHPVSLQRVAHAASTKVSLSLWDSRSYGILFRSNAQLLWILHSLFPALSRALTQALWSHMANLSNNPKFGASSHADNLMDNDPANDGEISSEDECDESDDAITSYAGSAPSSPIVTTLGHNTSHGLSRRIVFFSFFLFHLITSSIRGWHSHRHVFALFPSSPSIPSVMVSLL